MNNEFVQQLRAIVDRHPACLESPSKFLNFLADYRYGGSEPWRAVVLMYALKFGVNRLRESSNQALAYRQIADTVYNSTRIERACIDWALQTWCGVYGISVSLKNAGTETSVPTFASFVRPQVTQTNFSLCQVGDVLAWGSYRQDDKGTPLPIEWRVLRRDKDGLLVMSCLALDCRKYHEAAGYITWPRCALRTWLNEDFLNKAFSAEEQKRIVTVNNTYLSSNFNSWIPGGPRTKDRVFLLGYEEMLELLPDEDERCCKATAHAAVRGIVTREDGSMYSGNCSWWLRCSGDSGYDTAAVGTEGIVVGEAANSGGKGVRPVIKISY